jgi:hypothetical protein
MMRARGVGLGKVAVLVLMLALAGCSRSNAASRTESSPLAAADAAQRPPTPAQDAGTGKPFGASCTSDEECAARACFHKHVHDVHGTAEAGHEHKGADDAVQADGYCSIRCSDDGDCPVPPTAGHCGGRGMCKR